MKRKTLFCIFLILAAIFFCIYIGAVAYQWGYMQCAIDRNIAEFSAPANISLFTNIPYIIVAAVLFIIAFFIRKRK